MFRNMLMLVAVVLGMLVFNACGDELEGPDEGSDAGAYSRTTHEICRFKTPCEPAPDGGVK